MFTSNRGIRKRDVAIIASAGLVGLLLVGVLLWMDVERLTQPKPVDAMIAAVNVQPDTQPPVAKKEAPTSDAEVREKALAAAVARLNASEAEFDKAARKLADKHLSTIDAFFTERKKKGSPAFAEEMLSIRGKLKFVRGQVWDESADEYARYMRECFEQCLFTPGELNEVIKQAFAAYLVEFQGLENRLLMQLHADILLSDASAAKVIPALGSQASFDKAYRHVSEIAAKNVASELRADVAKEIASNIAGAIAGRIATRILTSVATRLGVSAGILATGTAASVGSFGISIAAAIVTDIAIEKLLKLAGYDPIESVAEKLNESLDGICEQIKCGHESTRREWNQLRFEYENNPHEHIRFRAKEAADAIARTGDLGLVRDMIEFHETRERLRRSAIRRLIYTGAP